MLCCAYDGVMLVLCTPLQIKSLQLHESVVILINTGFVDSQLPNLLADGCHLLAILSLGSIVNIVQRISGPRRSEIGV